MIGCTTCCRSYHPICLPSEPHRSQRWHCPGCLKRDWHIATPNLPSPTPRIETVDGQSAGGAHSLTSDLPETGRTSLVVQAFGESIETIADSNTDSAVARELDTLDSTSLARQGTGGVGTHVKDLPSYLTLIDPAESLHGQLHHGSGPAENSLLHGEVPGSSDLSAANKSYAYTMALERQLEQLRRKLTLMGRQQRTAGGAANAFHALSQENARLKAENRRLVALLQEMDSLRERNEVLQRQVEELSKSARD